jgi:hypothetical protein
MLLENKNAIGYGGGGAIGGAVARAFASEGRGSSSPAGWSTEFRRPPSEARYPVSYGSGPQTLRWHDSIESIE